jgi:hypothetical protein
VWKDTDQDGLTDQGELVSLASLGVVALNLSAQASTATDNGNLLGLMSSYETSDGQTHDLVDVWFRQGANAPEALRDSVGELTQSLGSYMETAAAAAASGVTVRSDSLNVGTDNSAASLTTSVSPTQSLTTQLDVYYQNKGMTPNPLALGANSAERLLSRTAPATATSVLISGTMATRLD